MFTNEKNAFNWIARSNEQNKQFSSAMNEQLNRIVRAAFASFVDMFDDPKMN